MIKRRKKNNDDDFPFLDNMFANKKPLETDVADVETSADADDEFQEKKKSVEKPEEKSSEEKYFDNNAHATELDGHTGAERIVTKQANFKNSGNAFMFMISVLMLIGLALPVSLIYLTKSPDPLEPLFIFGISYFKLVIIFFISTAIIVYSSLFFLRAKPGLVFPAFFISLFCCFPLVIGLKSDLTFYQTMSGIHYFTKWPLFFQPVYLLIEVIIPFGILTFILLQLKNIFSRKKTSFSYFCIALYLGCAAYVGFSTLIETGQPNLVSFVKNRIGSFNGLAAEYQYQNTPIPPGSMPPVTRAPSFFQKPVKGQPGVSPSQMQEIATKLDLVLLMLNTENTHSKNNEADSLNQQTSQPPPSPLLTNKQTEKNSKWVVSNIEDVHNMMNHLSDVISKIDTYLVKQKNETGKAAKTDEQIVSVDNLKPVEKTNAPSDIISEIKLEDISKELLRLSEKLDLISKAMPGTDDKTKARPADAKGTLYQTGG